MRSLLFAICLGFSVVRVGLAVAQAQPMETASQLAVEVTEVVSGGTWADGTASGSYRTVAVQTYVPVEAVDVFIQWIGTRGPAEPLQIISSVPLREFNSQRLTSASITLESEVEGIAKIIVAGQDASGRAAALVSFVATTPGRYEVMPPEPVAGK